MFCDAKLSDTWVRLSYICYKSLSKCYIFGDFGLLYSFLMRKMTVA